MRTGCLPPVAVACCALLWWAATAVRTGGQQTVVQAYGPGHDAHADLLKQILAELKGMRAELALLRPAAAQGPDAGPKLLAQRCASCHTGAAEQGNGFQIFTAEGKEAYLSVNDINRMERKIERNQMPPGGGLVGAEKDPLRKYLEAKRSKQPASVPEKGGGK